MNRETKHIKTSRTFTIIKKTSWVLVPIISVGGLFFPLLGLAVIGIMLALMMFGIFKGQYWCGNLCPHGSLFDRFYQKPSRFKKIPAFFQSPILKWLFFIFFMTMFIYRLIFVLGHREEIEFLPQLGSIFVNQYLVWPTIVGSFLALIINPRTWCTFCPMGTMQQIMNRMGKALHLQSKTEKYVTIISEEDCPHCGKCAAVCPMQLQPYKNWHEKQFKDEECIKCSVCVANCPKNLLSMKTLLHKN